MAGLFQNNRGGAYKPIYLFSNWALPRCRHVAGHQDSVCRDTAPALMGFAVANQRPQTRQFLQTQWEQSQRQGKLPYVHPHRLKGQIESKDRDGKRL